MKKGSGAKQSNTGNNPVDLVKAKLQEVQNELMQVVKSIIEKFPPGRLNSTLFRDIVEQKLGVAPNIGTNARVTINSNIITQIGKFDTKLKEKVVPYINHRAESISGQKKREVLQRKARLKNLRKKIQEQQKKIQEQRSKESTKITFEQYIDSQIEKQNATIESFDGLNEQEKKAKILELKDSNSQLQEDLQTLLAEKESSINAQLAIDDNFNLKTEFFNELTKYVTPVVTSSTFLGKSGSKELIEQALGTKITLEKNQESPPRYEVTLNTECQLGTKLDAIEKEIQTALEDPIDLEVAKQTTGLASTETEIESIQRYLAFDTPSSSNEINQKLLQIKTSVTKKLQEQKEKILELERRIEAEAQQNIEKESKARAQGQQVELGSDQVIGGSSLESRAEKKGELAIEEQTTFQGSYCIGDEVESLPTDNQGEIPEIIDEQRRLEELVAKLQKEVAELSQQLSEKDRELESFRSSNIGSLSTRIKELEQRLSKSESDRKNLFGSNNDNLSRLSSANEELNQLKLKLKDYEDSDVLVLRAEISNKEAEIAKMRVSIQEVNLGNAQLVVQDAKSRGEISILQQSLEEARQQNLLLQSQLLEARLAQTQNAQPLRQEDSISSILDTRRADSSDDSDSDLDDENFAETVKERAQILQKKRREIIEQNKLLLSENKELLQLLNSVGDELEKFEQLIATTDQKVLSLQQELVAINAQNQQLKSDLVEFKALSEVKVEALEAQLAESKASAEAKAQALEVELGRVIEEAKAINTIAQEEKAEAEAKAQEAQERAKLAEAQAKIAQEEKAEVEAKAQEAQERANLAEAKALKAEAELAKVQAEAKAELQRAKAEAEDKAKIAQEAQERAEAQAKTSQEEKARAEAQALEFKAKAQALEVELGGVIEEAKAIATGVQEDQARAKAEAEAKIAEAQANIVQEAQARAKAEAEAKIAEAQANIVQEARARDKAEAELQRMKLELEQTKAELAKEKARNIESESAKPSPSRSSTIGPAGWPPPPRTSFSRRRPRPSVKLTREMLGEDQGLTVDGRRARLFARSEQGGRRLLGDRRPKSRLLHQNSGIRLTSRRPKLKPNPTSKPETLSPTASVLPTASGADATKSSTVFSKPLPVFSIPARPEITASLLPSMPTSFEKTPPVSNHEPTLPSSLDLEPKKPNPTMTPSSITIFYSAYKRLEEQEDMIKDFLSKIAGGVVSDSYMKDKRIYSQQDILDFFETKGIEFKSYDQALDIIKGVFAENNAIKNQFAGSAVNISVSQIFKNVFLKQVKEALGPKRTITVSREG